jgi:hypothetical protein
VQRDHATVAGVLNCEYEDMVLKCGAFFSWINMEALLALKGEGSLTCFI